VRAARLQRLSEEVLQGHVRITNRTSHESGVQPDIRLLSKGEVLAKVGLSYVSVWKLIREGAFPRSVVIGGGKNAWLEHEVDAWIAALPRRRLKGQTDGVPYKPERSGGRST
jgi:predicted DNA-binding transcriptional regulator AlpA